MKRKRLTNSQIKSLKAAVIELAHQFGPIGVRGLFYRAVVAGLIEKTETEYDRIQRLVKDTRLNGGLPWELVIDESRRCDRVATFADVKELLEAAKNSFKLDPWIYQPCSEVTRRFRVPLFPGKGFTSLSFSRRAALTAIDALKQGQRVVVLQWGDYDPSGLGISESLAEHYRLHGAVDAEVIRVGLKAEHIDLWGLPTRPTKQTDSRAAKFGDDRSVELDALEPAKLKEWIETEILQFIDKSRWESASKEERAELKKLTRMISRRAA